MTMHRLLAGVLAALATLATQPSGFAADCQGRIGAETAIASGTAYDPFSPTDLAEDHRISIGNTGSAPCSYGLVLRSRTARPVLGATLTYALIGATGTSLLTSAPAHLAPVARLPSPLAPSATGLAEVQLTIPRGQYAAPGTYRDAIDMELYALDGGGHTSGPALDTAALTVSVTVPRVLSVNIRGGGLTSTLSFGALSEGQERTVAIEARSNESYRIDVTSDHRGALALTPAVPGREWSVPYAVTFAGQRLDLSGKASLLSLPPTRSESHASHPLTVTIGEVGYKRAGQYEDVITVEITAAIP
jgi:hypothetical protein